MLNGTLNPAAANPLRRWPILLAATRAVVAAGEVVIVLTAIRVVRVGRVAVVTDTLAIADRRTVHQAVAEKVL